MDNSTFALPYHLKIVLFFCLFSVALLLFFIIFCVQRLINRKTPADITLVLYEGVEDEDDEELENSDKPFYLEENDLEYFSDGGLVRKAKLKNENLFVDVKTYLPDNFLKEVHILRSAGQHPNVLFYVGELPNKNLLVTEHINGGNLKDYLKSHKGNFKDQVKYSDLDQYGYQLLGSNKKTKTDEYVKDLNTDGALCTIDLVSFVYQIANGMEHLANKKIAHNELSVDNILLTSNKTIRIAGFHLARKSEKCYSAPGTGSQNQNLDPWSLGIVIYEIFSFGDTSVLGVQNEDISMYLKSGGLPNELKYCPRKIHGLMTSCFYINPADRPDFPFCTNFLKGCFDDYDAQVFEDLQKKLEDVSENQRKLNMYRENSQIH